ncbi:MAG: HAD-IA family hydrolase [Acetatifactor sp.]|nr:HAD-IA family hydrolase [Acetatifactor sp.]
MNPAKYELVIFDMDGTILNMLEDLADSLNHVLELFGYPVRTLDEVKSFVGNGLKKLIERAAPEDVPEETRNQIYREHLKYYREHCADKTKPYDGIVSLIKNLRQHGKKTAVVSNKADAAVHDLCHQYFEGLFDAAVGERESIAKKPAPDMVDAILETLAVPRDKAVYIGDSEVDIAMARNAGMDCVIVSWGFREKVFLRSQGADRIVDTAEELQFLLQ